MAAVVKAKVAIKVVEVEAGKNGKDLMFHITPDAFQAFFIFIR
jgi:hypothetical protein